MPEVELKKIKPNRLNPRAGINIEKLNELSDSIKEAGIIEPIIVRPIGDKYGVVVGERRYKAAKKAGLDKIPVIIKTVSDDQVIELNLIENIHREDLTDVEKGRSILKLQKEFPKEYPDLTAVSKALGLPINQIANWVTTTKKLSPEVQKMVVPPTATGHGRRPPGKISGYTARVIASKIKEPKRQIKTAKEISEKRFSHRTEQRILSEVAKKPEKPVEEIVKEIEEEPAELPFRLSHMQPILDGVKIQTSRKYLNPKIKEDAIVKANLWQPDFAQLRVKKVERKKLRDFTEEDAKREGGYTLEEFKKVWKNLHGNWDPDGSVNVIIFEKIKKEK